MRKENNYPEYPNIPSMEMRIQELTQKLKEMDFDSLGYKIIWDERAALKRELAALEGRTLDIPPA